MRCHPNKALNDRQQPVCARDFVAQDSHNHLMACVRVGRFNIQLERVLDAQTFSPEPSLHLPLEGYLPTPGDAGELIRQEFCPQEGL